MAHMAKYKQAQVAPMVRHYERRLDATLERANIDAERSHLNYEVGIRYNSVERFVQSYIADHNEHGRAIRADAVVLADCVLTLPQGFPEERTREFFEAAHSFFQERYSSCIVPQGYVHMDEATPHMHQPIIPFNIETQRFQASKLINRYDLQTMHSDMERYLCEELGMERVGVTLTEQERGARTLDYLDLAEYKEANDELQRSKQEASEAVQELAQVRGQVVEAKQDLKQVQDRVIDASEQLEKATQQVAAKRAEVADARSELQRLEGHRRSQEAENSGLDQRISELEKQIEQCKQEPSIERERGQQPEGPERAATEAEPKLGRELVEAAKLTAAAGLGGARSVEAEQRSEAATARDLDQRIEQAKEGQRFEAEDAERNQQEERERHEGEAGSLGGRIERAEEQLRGIRGRYSELEQRVGELQQRLEGLVTRFAEQIRELTQNMGLEGACERVGTWICERQDDLGTRLFDAKYEFRDRFGDIAERFFDEWGRLKTRFELEYERETGEWPLRQEQKQQPLAEAAEVARDASRHSYGIDDVMRDIERAERARGYNDDDGGGGRWRDEYHERDYGRGLER